jgi:hypothetical protein
MYRNFVENIIELNCRKVDVSVNEEHGVQIIFEGDNELDYFLIQRIYDWGNDEDAYISVFYTEGCDNSGNWTYISAILESNYVQFSIDRFPVRIHLPKMTPKKYTELRDTLELLLRHLGKLTANGRLK